MNWKQENGYITTEGTLKASVKYHRLFEKYVVRVGGLSAHGSFGTEEEAKQFGEEQLKSMKRAVILSLIKKITSREYSFGGLLCIANVKDDIWRVSNEREYLFQGTLEECKNYIAECF